LLIMFTTFLYNYIASESRAWHTLRDAEFALSSRLNDGIDTAATRGT
jgi:hypothetical protein